MSRVESSIFSRLEVFFHGLDFAVIFTGRNYVSRVVSKIFSREGSSFHGNKIDFFHGLQKSFHGKKKTLPGGRHGLPVNSDILSEGYIKKGDSDANF